MGFESANEIKRVTLKPQRRTHHLVAPLHVINSDFHLIHLILLDVRLFQVSRYLAIWNLLLVSLRHRQTKRRDFVTHPAATQAIPQIV